MVRKDKPHLVGHVFQHFTHLYILPVFANVWAKVRQELQGRVEELRFYLKAAEQRLVECEKRLQHSERMCSEKSRSIVQLQAKVCDWSRLLPMDVKFSDVFTSGH